MFLYHVMLVKDAIARYNSLCTFEPMLKLLPAFQDDAVIMVDDNGNFIKSNVTGAVVVEELDMCFYSKKNPSNVFANVLRLRIDGEEQMYITEESMKEIVEYI